MPLPISFLAKQTTNTSGTGTLTLNAATAQFRSFARATGNAAACVQYRISLSGSSEWEIGIGVFNGASPGTLTRVEVSDNHLGTTSLVSFSAGTKDVQLLSLPGTRRQVDFSSNTTASLADLGGTYNFTGSSNANLQLPTAATVPINSSYMIRNAGTAGAVVSILGGGSDNVGAFPSLSLLPTEMIQIWATANGWITSGLPAVAFIRTETISGTPSAVDFVLPVQAATYEVTFHRVTTSADAQLGLTVSENGGSSYYTGGTDYGRAYNFESSAGTNADANQGASIIITPVGDADGDMGGQFRLYTGISGRRFQVMGGQSSNLDTSGALIQGGNFHGQRSAAGAVNSIRISPSSGTFTGGFISLYLRRT